MENMPRKLREPAPEPVYARVDRLEDINSHFYNIIKELRERFFDAGRARFDAGEEVRAFTSVIEPNPKSRSAAGLFICSPLGTPPGGLL